MNEKDITIVIMSRGREEILRKSLKFWGTTNLSVLVLHNSMKPLNPKNIPGNIAYVLAGNIPYNERCGMAIKYINTRFAILCADDELYLPESLLNMTKPFDYDKRIKSVGGRVVAISRYGPRKTFALCYQNMINYENLGFDHETRLQKHFDSRETWRNGSMYRIMERDLFCSMMKAFSYLKDITTPYIYEVTAEIIVNAEGGSIITNNLYWVRNWINEQVQHSSWNRKVYFKDWYKDEKYSEEVSRWKTLLEKYFQTSLEEHLQRLLTLRIVSENHEITKLQRATIPVPIIIKYLVRKIFKPSTIPSSIAILEKSLDKSGISFNSSELNRALSAMYS